MELAIVAAFVALAYSGLVLYGNSPKDGRLCPYCGETRQWLLVPMPDGRVVCDSCQYVWELAELD
jgi:hypothetical protein